MSPKCETKKLMEVEYERSYAMGESFETLRLRIEET